MTIAEARKALQQSMACEVYSSGGWLDRGWHPGKIIRIESGPVVVVNCPVSGLVSGVSFDVAGAEDIGRFIRLKRR